MWWRVFLNGDELRKICSHLKKLSFLIYHCVFIKQGIVDLWMVQKSEYQWNIAGTTVKWSLNCYYYHFNYLCSKLYNITITLKDKYRPYSHMGHFFLQIIFTINQKSEFQVLLRNISLAFESYQCLLWVSLLYSMSAETFIWANKIHMYK